MTRAPRAILHDVPFNLGMREGETIVLYAGTRARSSEAGRATLMWLIRPSVETPSERVLDPSAFLLHQLQHSK